MSSLPFPITFREHWLPQHINGTQLPPSADNGHALTLSGASKCTTTDGVHFTGVATSNMKVTADADQNGKAAMHITIRFKLDQTFTVGAAADLYLFRKADGATYLRIYLESTDGKLYWEQDNGAGGAGFSLTSTETSWTAGTWYIVTCSLTGTGPAQRLIVNGGTAVTASSAAVVTPSGGDMIIGSSSDGGTDGVVGTISWVVIGVGTNAVTLSAAEETDLSNGFSVPLAKTQYMYLMDEGRGTSCTNKGGGAGGAGALDTACTWAYGQVEAPVLSADGINDTANSAASVADISGALSVALVVKCRNTLTSTNSTAQPFGIRVDANNRFVFYHETTNGFIARMVSSGGDILLTDTTTPSIGDYRIYLFTITSAGAIAFYINGASVDTDTGVGARTVGGATVYLANTNGSGFCSDAILEASVIEGALTAAQAKAYSRYLRDKYNLPVTI